MKQTLLSKAVTLSTAALLALVSFPVVGAAAPTYPELDTKLDAIWQTPDHELSGMAVASVKNGEVEYIKGFGSRYIDPANPANNLPVTPDTKFRIASVSKFVASIGAMKLVEEGKLDLDKDISDYLGFTLRNPDYPDTPITTRMILSHTSSIRDGSSYSLPLPGKLSDFFTAGGSKYEDGAHFAAKDPADPLKTAPGNYFSYENINFGVLGSIMEVASGKRFDTYMAEDIFTPLGITASYNVDDFDATTLNELATLYRKGVGGDTWDPTGPWVPQHDDHFGGNSIGMSDAQKALLANYELGSNGTLFGPQGSLRISTKELTVIMQLMLNEGTYNGVQILKPETVKQMLTPQWEYMSNGEDNGDTYWGLMREWGLGAQYLTGSSDADGGDAILPANSPTFWGHLGDAYGLYSGIMFDMDTKSGLIYIIGGVASDPEEYYGDYSTFYKWEEEILSSLFEETLQADYDAMVPVTSLFGDYEGWKNSDALLRFTTGSGVPTGTKYSINGGPEEAYSTWIPVTEEGENVITYYSENGNGKEASKESVVRIDKTAPVTTFGGVADGGTYTAPVTVSLKSSDPLSGIHQVFVNEEQVNAASTFAPTNPELTAEMTFSEPGNYTLTAYAVDTAGNAEQAKSVSFTIAKTSSSTGKTVYPANTASGSSPSTGDDMTMVYVLAALLFASAAATVLLRKKKRLASSK